MHIITRTDKITQLKNLLKERNVIYLSSFFYSGKTVLLEQLEKSLKTPVIRYDAEKDDWNQFEESVKKGLSGTLILDSLHQIQDFEIHRRIAVLINNLPSGINAVLAGRARMPEGLEAMCYSAAITVLDKDFLMFTEEEIEQLFLEYDISLCPDEIRYLKETTLGWPFGIQTTAQSMKQTPGVSVQTLSMELRDRLKYILYSDVILAFRSQERILLYNLSPFTDFTGDMARIVTGQTDAPAIMKKIAEKTYMLNYHAPDLYSFLPFVRETLFQEMKNHYTQDYINNLYQRAGLYYELKEDIPKAIDYYLLLENREKIRELLIREARKRPGNGSVTDLKAAYEFLSDDEILSDPELMKGMSMIESLKGHPEESERWYQDLKKYISGMPSQDVRRKTAREAAAYLDIALAQRGTSGMLSLLSAIAKKPEHGANDWKYGFNIAGNSVSLLNGGKDFCRWVPHGWLIYRIGKKAVESALGCTGKGVGDIAIAECELESSLTGGYTAAMDKLFQGASLCSQDQELYCAATGIKSRILAAQGNAPQALQIMEHLIETLPPSAPDRLKKNMQVHKLQLELLNGDTQAALSWLETQAPDETREFLILDRYALMLKFKMYIITGQWTKLPYLAALLRHYFDSYDRPYMMVQLHLLQAVADFRNGKKSWKSEMEAALSLAKRYHLVRVIADEGTAVITMLEEVLPEETAWASGVIRLTKVQASNYPGYMRAASERPVFSDREYQVYSLLIAGYKNAKIAAVLNITERTVKHYTGEIYRKLGVKTRAEALSRAYKLGDIRS